MKIKIFLDGADRSAIIEMAANSLVQGFTTNPSLMRKSGVKDYRAFCQEILTHVKGKPISFEVFADDFPTMRAQALEIKSWEKPGDQLYVKVPIMNTKGESAAPLIRELTNAKVKLNVTALFTLTQVWETCLALKGGAPSIASIFVGRLADIGLDPMPLALGASAMCAETDKNIECLWASTREAYNIVQAEQAGCKIITAPADVVKKASGFGGKSPYQMSMETIRTFKSDSDAAGFQL